MDKGGKVLSKDEVTTLLTGARVSGIQTARPDVKFQLLYKPDGTMDGSAIIWRTNQGYVTLTGKWSINEKGQTCNALRNSLGQIPEGTGNCNFWFRLGDAYYMGRSQERDEPAYPREVKR